jgi:Leucine-rich repeat (LRR) protein
MPAKIASEFPGYRRSSGVGSGQADGALPPDRAVLTKEYLLMKTTHWSLTGAALILALATCMTASVLADEAEDKAVKAIEKLGGQYGRDEKAKGKPIVRVFLLGPKVKDAGLKLLAGLKQLKLLNLQNTQVTDGGLKHLAGLKQLRSLLLFNAKVTDAGLKELAGLKQLRSLDFSKTKVTDAGLKHLAGLKQLQTLELRHTKVTDAGLKHLAGLKQLLGLGLGSTQVTDAGLKHLGGLKQLQLLDLGKTKVTAKGKADLKEALPKLVIIG